MPEETQKTPLEVLASLSDDAPSQDVINGWKSQVPGNRVRVYFSTDMKRAYVMRPISALQLQRVQEQLPKANAPEEFAANLQRAVAAGCCLWTNQTANRKLTEIDLNGSGAGLSATLQEVVSQISDYADPVTIDRFSADL